MIYGGSGFRRAARRAYLDHNATTPLRPGGARGDVRGPRPPGNASSIHAEGRAARAVIETARIEIGALVGRARQMIVFTSGGTEALNLALTPHFAAGAAKQPFDLLLAAPANIRASSPAIAFRRARRDSSALTPEAPSTSKRLTQPLPASAGRRVMLALQAANNETGVIQPVAAAARLVHAAGGFLVCDGVQAAGKADCDIARLGADAMVVSAHKFGGPQGVGALCFRSTRFPYRRSDDARRRAGARRCAPEPRMSPASPAWPRRSAAAKGRRGRKPRPSPLGGTSWRRKLRASRRVRCFSARGGAVAEYVVLCGSGDRGADFANSLDIEGVAVSSGSACSSGKVKRSHVLARWALRRSWRAARSGSVLDGIRRRRLRRS